MSKNSLIKIFTLLVIIFSIGCEERQPGGTVPTGPGVGITEQEKEAARTAYNTGNYELAVVKYNEIVTKSLAGSQEYGDSLAGLGWAKVKQESNPNSGIEDFERGMPYSNDAKVGYAWNSVFSVNDAVNSDPASTTVSKSLAELNKIDLANYTSDFESATVTRDALYALRGFLNYISGKSAEAESDFAYANKETDAFAKKLYDAYARMKSVN